METQIWSSCAIAFLTILSLHFFLTKILRRKKLVLPPGPKPWPVIGNLNLIGALPHHSIHELSQKYGALMQLWFGSIPVVVGSSPDMAKIFLKTMDINFASRPKTAAGKYTTYNYSDITWSPYGPYWRQARKMCLMELFSPRRLESYECIRAEEMGSLLKEVFKASRKPIHVRNYLSTMSLNVISRMVLDLQGYVKRMEIVSKKFDGFLEHVLNEHEERRKKSEGNYVSRDMVDVLLEFAENPDLEVKLERHGVKAFIQDLLGGGTESSTIIVEWAISELLKKPENFKAATEELNRVIGQNKWVKEKDIPKLPYINAIIKETMRLHPVVPMLVPRLARANCKVDGYDIKKGTQVLVNVWTIGRDPSLWENATEFCPERFIGKAIDVKGHDFELLPFGSGRRMCPGYSLGLKVIQSSLANLLHGFNWKLPDNMGHEDLDMEEIFGLSTSRKIPLVTVAEPRLSIELYSQ
ncbi:flavonoid 3' 5'-hydroxylase 2 [Phtheirospermum japonicum]|uniref:Flavonoid 3' 5'-hydroxylase 2 n=1 Tax=Phtheirospermum japonicum TaxID=374723 RepID=A0A830BRW6_9LAMI|nr:flavonoid 3' 5'-hydroxylase 2 [Phtheirospermum japonicum]